MKLSKFDIANHVYKDAKRDKAKDAKHARKVNKQAKREMFYKLAQN